MQGGTDGKRASGKDAPIAVFALRQDATSVGVLQTALSRFDAAKAQCFLPKDRHKLLGVIETAFGDLRPFNKLCRSILKEGVTDTGSAAAAPKAERRGGRWISFGRAVRILP